MRKHLSELYRDREQIIDTIIQQFDDGGRVLAQSRNTIKVFKSEGLVVNVKSFAIPIIVNKIAYRFFRKGKAKRSFEFGQQLIKLGIGTPEPVGYYEFYKGPFFDKSFYISRQIEDHFTFRELLREPRRDDFEEVLRSFTRFTCKMHDASVFFLDHSQGNTLIRKSETGYEFFLVDLNRMKFKALDLRERIKNFERLATLESDVYIMSDEFAKITGLETDEVFQKMWTDTQQYQEKFWRKRRLKKKIKSYFSKD